MKRLIAACVALCVGFAVFGAEVVDYSIPVLTVKVDGEKVVPGSGRMDRCPFSFVATTNATPVRVSIMEDMPSGAGNSLRASLWLATTTASLTLNRSLSGATVSFETSGSVDGPSAGGMLCLAVMSALEGKPFPDDFAMTGTIMADGTVGAVGGTAEKIRAAGRAGIKRICIPAYTRIDEEDFTDLLDLGKSLNVEMHQVATIAEAYRTLHRLPVPQVVRLNAVEVCRLPSPVEDLLKDRFGHLFRMGPRDSAMWNRPLIKALEEYYAGLFGAAVMDMIKSLEDYSFAACCVEAPDVAAYPSLANELPTNDVSIVGKLLGGVPTKAQYVAELRAFHQDLKRTEEALRSEDAESCDLDDENPKEKSAASADSETAWFDDFVESPIAAQFFTLAVVHYTKSHLYYQFCRDLTRKVEEVGDWNNLDAAHLNAIRATLVSKLNLLAVAKSYGEGTENYRMTDALYGDLRDAMPYMRPNARIRQVESVFYRTMKAMDSALRDNGMDEDGSVSARWYGSLLDWADASHAKQQREVDTLNAIFVEAQTLANACALLMRPAAEVAGRTRGNAAFYSAVVSTARENALANIAECQKLGLPCVMPVICFQLAETKRDNCAPDEDAEMNRINVLSNYLQASLSAKALVLCFAGQKPELNGKGYCSRCVWSDESNMTVRYLGVDGKPILRDGFGGYGLAFNGGADVVQRWLDLEGRAVRVKGTNETYTAAYDASGRWCRKTYCNDSWVPTPQGDGVLFETYGYDADGQWNCSEYFDTASNRVACADGMAIIKMRYNKRGQETSRRYYGVKGELVVPKKGYAGYDIVYDRNGNERRCTFVDDKEHPVAVGCARIERKYDAQNRETECAWYDAQGKLVCVDGVAKICNEYDDRGNWTAEAYYGADGRLVRGNKNYAVARWSYNASGEATACRYYGPDGYPTLHRDGSASWETVFDAAGRNVGRKYYDLDGKEIDMDERKDDNTKK